jgi:hypothetical protein
MHKNCMKCCSSLLGVLSRITIVAVKCEVTFWLCEMF